jgi:hypothetical protein
LAQAALMRSARCFGVSGCAAFQALENMIQAKTTTASTYQVIQGL